MALEATTTIKVYRTDRPLLDGHGKTTAEAVRRLVRPCEHVHRVPKGHTVVFYPQDQRTVPVTVFHCNDCGALIVLPGQAVESE